MKIRLLVECEGPNPEWNPPNPKDDFEAWQTYPYRVAHTIKLPVGTEIDHPDAWVHCLPYVDFKGVVRPPRAEPLDDNAKLMTKGKLGTCDKETKAVYENFWATRKATEVEVIEETE